MRLAGERRPSALHPNGSGYHLSVVAGDTTVNIMAELRRQFGPGRGARRPPATSVSDALTLPPELTGPTRKAAALRGDTDVRAVAEAALRTIDRMHKDGALPTLPVQTRDDPSSDTGVDSMIRDPSDEENIRILVEQMGFSEERARFVVALERGAIEGDMVAIDGPLTTEQKRRLGLGGSILDRPSGGKRVDDRELPGNHGGQVRQLVDTPLRRVQVLFGKGHRRSAPR